MQRRLRLMHLWLGLTAGSFIVIMALTGSVIVFRNNIENQSRPVSAEPTSAGLSALQGQLAALNPSAQIRRIGFYGGAQPVLVQIETKEKKRMQLYADGASGQLLGAKGAVPWLDWLADLHQNLLNGKTGRALTGLIGIALLLLSLSGLWSWFAGSRIWSKALALPPSGPWKRVNYQLHTWAGLWMNAFLIVISATGMVLAYPSLLERESPRHPAPKGVRAALLPLGRYREAALAAIPDGEMRELRLPERGGATVSATLWLPGDIRPGKGGSAVVLEAGTARVLSVERYAEAPMGKKAVDLANAIHKVELVGWPLKAVWSTLGLTPVFLFFSGFQIWWSRSRAGRERWAKIRTSEQKPAAHPDHRQQAEYSGSVR